MNRDQAAKMVLKYALEATDRLKPEEDGYMRPDGRQLFEVQPLDEFIIDIRKELLDVMNYAAFGLKRLDDILADMQMLGIVADVTRVGQTHEVDLAKPLQPESDAEHSALRRHRQLMGPVNDALDAAALLESGGYEGTAR